MQQTPIKINFTYQIQVDGIIIKEKWIFTKLVLLSAT